MESNANLSIVDMGCVQYHYDYSLSTQNVDLKLVVILLYVDDLLVAGCNLALIKQVKKIFQEIHQRTYA